MTDLAVYTPIGYFPIVPQSRDGLFIWLDGELRELGAALKMLGVDPEQAVVDQAPVIVSVPPGLEVRFLEEGDGERADWTTPAVALHITAVGHGEPWVLTADGVRQAGKVGSEWEFAGPFAPRATPTYE